MIRNKKLSLRVYEMGITIFYFHAPVQMCSCAVRLYGCIHGYPVGILRGIPGIPVSVSRYPGIPVVSPVSHGIHGYARICHGVRWKVETMGSGK